MVRFLLQSNTAAGPNKPHDTPGAPAEHCDIVSLNDLSVFLLR
tara:strand:- start:437 stop:565 length:129 start_codon:yes stop_codon:yes gene_type:complete